jgi:hypothetical protein
VLLWLVFNSGFSDAFPPLLPGIQAAPRGAATVQAFLAAAGTGLAVIGSFWAAMTLGLWLRDLWAATNAPAPFKGAALGWSIFLGPFAMLILWHFGGEFAGIAGVIWLLPIVQVVIPLALTERTPPTYSRAKIKVLGGKYLEAESAVIEELEKAEDDFNGWLMLAELYAHHFDDLAGADRLVRDTCSQANATPSEICVAFNRLADWHLNLAADPLAAREALEEVCRQFPGTHMAHMARQRIDHLPGSREELIALRTPRAIRLPALGKNLEQPAADPPSFTERKEAAAQANDCVKRLEKNPDDMAVREELARILAERLGKTEAAIEQIELLVNIPGVSAGQAAQWMGLMAAWQIKYQGDTRRGRETMEQLIRLYPRSSEAFAAQRRLFLMDLEAKIRAARAQAPPAAEKPISLFRSS